MMTLSLPNGFLYAKENEYTIIQNSLRGPIEESDHNSFITQYELYVIFSLMNRSTSDGGRVIVVMFDLHSKEHKKFIQSVINYPWELYKKNTEKRYGTSSVIIVKSYKEMVEKIIYNLGSIGYLPKGNIIYNDNDEIVELNIKCC